MFSPILRDVVLHGLGIYGATDDRNRKVAHPSHSLRREGKNSWRKSGGGGGS
jgi:hypothetical protein